MNHYTDEDPNRREGSLPPWDQLARLCRRIHKKLYVKRDRASALDDLHLLERLLHDLPQNDEAIVKQEALALSCELRNDIPGAIKYREKEIERIEKLHEDVRIHDYDERTRAWILQHRGLDVLKERRAILKLLENTPEVEQE